MTSTNISFNGGETSAQPVTPTVVFMGSPGFSVPTLILLHQSKRYEVVLVVTQPDKPQGRGRKVAPTPVRSTAEALGLPVAIREKGGYGELRERISLLKPDFIVVVAFGLILREDILAIPKYGCINLHASLLPRYRGVSPISSALLAGEQVTGCTSMFMDQGIDTGAILLERETPILPEDTAGSLSVKLAVLGAHVIADTLERILSGSLAGRAQDESKATYTRKLKKDDGKIDWSRDAEYIARLVRAMHPWPTAYTFFASKRLIVLGARACAAGGTGSLPGAVVSTDPLRVSCGLGALEIGEVKVQGKERQSAGEFVSVNRISAGTVLSGEVPSEGH
ncbi:MAG: methionyl-tRNA formyltransferase [Chitinivibrionia bacterium]|nr:methionyl-tRNA formyltransferase [Chitinivibrionia bacterium]